MNNIILFSPSYIIRYSMSNFQFHQSPVHFEISDSTFTSVANLSKCSIRIARLEACHLNNDTSQAHGISWKSMKKCKRQLRKFDPEILGKFLNYYLVIIFLMINSIYDVLILQCLFFTVPLSNR